MFIEHYRFMDALYMTIITVTTVGFSEVNSLSEAGRLFTIFLLITSLGAFALALTRITQYIVSGEINKYFKQRRVMSAIEKLSNHVIVCGYGRNGQQAIQTLQSHNQPFIIIEHKQDQMNKVFSGHPNLLGIVGDSTEDEVLIRAGIRKAKALITTLPVDADNLFIVLSARSLNNSIQIISRASQSASHAKLIKAGADHVIMPDSIGGRHMATLVNKPDVVEFIDYISGEEGGSIYIESIAYEQLPEAIRDRSLKEIMDWKKSGVNCIGIKNTDGKFIINPSEDSHISPNMKILVLGTRGQVEEMKDNLE